ncbi:MAG: NAD(P)/FAD-dependent oxidoreductase [Treponema sp.]|nr:NAD(P)/FAD-dependent oxidoreductase [Treponema sp.]
MQYDVAVIGCGVIGAAVAYELSKYKLNVMVVEAENDVADVTTKANSGILHAGFDPEPGMTMTKLNVDGVAMAKTLCKKLDVPVTWCGSYVVAFNDEEMKTVKKLYDRGVANGVPDMEILNAEQVHNQEKNLSDKIKGALYAPTAGVVSPWEYALAFIETAVRNGTELRRNFRVNDIKKEEGGYVIKSQSGEFVHAKYVVNAAGLYSDFIHNLVSKPKFKIQPCRGEYYLLDKNTGDLVNHVIFQCPNKDGKGVLVSPTCHGNIIVGPNAEDSDRDDVSITQKGLDFVAEKAKLSVPSLDLRTSIRNFAGVRANVDTGDFVIEEAENAPGFIDLGGIKSPGLTSAPAIAVRCAELLDKAGCHLDEKKSYIDTRKRIKFNHLSVQEKTELIKKNPLYGRIICRCETITEGEIIDALRSPVPPVSVDGIKRRCGTGMGRCQGGFCGPRVIEILMNETHISYKDVLQDKTNSFILEGITKKESECDLMGGAQ